MSLKDTLLQDMKEAMKEKDVIRKNTIQLIRSGVLQVEKDKQIVLDDDGVFDVIVKELKHRRDALPEFEKSGRDDLINSLKKEIEVLLGYLPKQMSSEEIKEAIDRIISETKAETMKDMGKVMAKASEELKGRADNKIISGYVKERLSGK